MFLLGLFARPGGTLGTVALAGGGGLLIFLGVASLSSTVARPVTRLIGWPVAKLFGTPGKLARENAGRAPRRTSATASALMIGVALVSAAAVFASSLRATFVGILERGVTADFLVTDQAVPGPAAGRRRDADGVPEVAAASTPIRGSPGAGRRATQVPRRRRPDALEQLINLDLTDGGYEGLADGGVLVHKDPAEDLDLAVGDTVPVTFQNGETPT